MIVILVICLISFVGVLIYCGGKEMNGDGRTSKVVEAPKKAEPTIQISINLFDDHTVLEEICYQVSLSQAAFYIPNLNDALVYNSSDFIVMGVKRDFNTKNVIITAYKASCCCTLLNSKTLKIMRNTATHIL